MDRRAFVTRLTGAFREYARTSKKFEQNFRSRVTGTVSDVQCDITTAISDVTPLSLVDSSKHSSNSPSFRDEFVYAEDEGSRFFEMSVPKNQITRRHIPEGLITNDLNGADFMSFGINSDLRLPILTNATILVCVYWPKRAKEFHPKASHVDSMYQIELKSVQVFRPTVHSDGQIGVLHYEFQRVAQNIR